VLRPGPARAAGVQHVIEGGREADVLGLVQPFAPEADVVPGAPLSAIRIDRTAIVYVVGAAGGPTASLELRHPKDDGPPTRERSASFALRRQVADGAPPELTAALDALAQAVVRNDGGGFWRSVGYDAPKDAALTARETGVVPDGLPGALWAFASDGVLLFLLGLGLLLAQVRRALRSDPRWAAWGLLGVLAVGLVVRLALPIATTMTAHPFDRVVPLAWRAFLGPALGFVVTAADADVFLTDVISWTNLLLSVVTPLAVFAAARPLLRDPLAALAAAAVVALLPLHVRFARSDVYLVQGVVLAALTLSTMTDALHADSRRWRWLSLGLLPLLAWATFAVRPESVAIYPAFVGAALFVLGAGAPLRRRLVVVGLLTAALVPTGMAVAGSQSHQISEGLGPRTLLNAWRVLTEARFNPLFHPWATPLGVSALAIAGGVVLWLRRERWTALLLAGWFLAFLVMHAYIRPDVLTMQARYHQNLLLPYALLAAAAIAALARWRRYTLAAVGLYLLTAPFVHAGFIRDVDYVGMHEYALLGRAREAIPEGCTVLEYTGFDGARRLTRVGRFGLTAAGFRERQRWRLIETGAAPDAARPLTPEARAAIDEPPECLMVWEGLTCYSNARVGELFAPACAALHEELALEPVLTTRVPNRFYDENELLPAAPPLDWLEFTLYRAARRPPDAAATAPPATPGPGATAPGPGATAP
jgi:hypothetical protein